LAASHASSDHSTASEQHAALEQNWSCFSDAPLYTRRSQVGWCVRWMTLQVDGQGCRALLQPYENNAHAEHVINPQLLTRVVLVIANILPDLLRSESQVPRLLSLLVSPPFQPSSRYPSAIDSFLTDDVFRPHLHPKCSHRVSPSVRSCILQTKTFHAVSRCR
jgi:hypothetical protein